MHSLGFGQNDLFIFNLNLPLPLLLTLQSLPSEDLGDCPSLPQFGEASVRVPSRRREVLNGPGDTKCNFVLVCLVGTPNTRAQKEIRVLCLRQNT